MSPERVKQLREWLNEADRLRDAGHIASACGRMLALLDVLITEHEAATNAPPVKPRND